MKLLNRAILYYSLAMLLSFIYTGALLYTSIRHLVLRQVSESLLTEKQIVQEQIEHSDTVPDFTDIFKHQIEVVVYKHRIVQSQNFIDTMLYDTLNHRQAAYRFLVFTSNTPDNRGFMITTSKSIDQEKSLLFEILGIIIILFAVLSLLLIIIISSISQRLWGSFYKTLANIQGYDVKTNQEFIPVPTRIREFGQLNKVLKVLTEKIRSEYLNLKEFSENASHEIQTPLAVIRIRIEQILQSPEINHELAEYLVSIGQSVNKISRINQALILISRIENSQFTDVSNVNVNQKIRDILSQFHDFITSRKLSVSFDETESVDIQMNYDLADFLFTNLLGNAIKHNVDEGWITIRLNNREFTVVNSGKDPQVNTNQLFLRFKKAEHSTDSPGLGLAIVKKVTDLYGIEISYDYAEGVHTLHMRF
jgi:signal transduction histidine kinase